MHPDLRHAALLKSMDITHHLKADDRLPYREGVTIPFPSSKREKGTLVDVGYCQAVLPNDDIEPYTRVTLDMTRVKEPAEVEYIRNTTLASPTDPTTKLGYYWGYATRQADSLSKVITESPYENGYDFVIGTSERGESLTPDLLVTLPEFSHLLVVFGGQAGIEAAAENDSELPLGSENISDLFDWWVNCVPGQGSRTIRTEEAVWIALSQIYSAVQRQGIK
jgi:methyltransferase